MLSCQRARGLLSGLWGLAPGGLAKAALAPRFGAPATDGRCAVCGAWLGSGWGCRATTGRFMVWSRMMMRFWNSASVAVHATLKRMPQYDDATMVFHV